MHDAPGARRARAFPSPDSAGWPLLCFAAVFAIAAVHYAGQTLARGPDQTDILLALFHDASHAIASDGLLAAMYTPGAFGGIPNWSNPNFHLLYPLYFNWAGADATVSATLDRLNLIIHLHLAILSAGTFVLSRALGVRLLPAIAVALLVPWMPAVRAASGWPHIIAGTAWLPWILAFQARLAAGDAARWRTALPASAGLALAATLMVFAHPAQSVVLAVAGSAILWLALAIQSATGGDGGSRDARAGLARAAAWTALAAALVLLCCGAYAWELVRFHGEAIRWLGAHGGHVIGSQSLPADALRLHALPTEHAGDVLAFQYRRGVGNGYMGAAVLVAAAAVLARSAGPRPVAGRALLAVAACALLACFAFMAPLMASVPLAGKVRELIWWSGLAVVPMLPLAALGMQRLQARAPQPPQRRDPWAWAAGLALAVSLVATWRSPPAYRGEALVALVLAFAAFAWVLRSRGARTRDLAIVAVVACSVWIPFRHNIKFEREEAMLFLPDRVQARADAARLRALFPDVDQYRVALSPALPGAGLLANSFVAAGLRSLAGGIGPFPYAKFRLLGSPTPAVAALYGVRYTLAPVDGHGGDVRQLRPGLALHVDANALPRLFALEGAPCVVEDPIDTLRGLAPRDLPVVFARAADLPVAPRGGPTCPGHRLPRGEVVLHAAARTTLRASVVVRRPAVLVLNEDPGARWRVRVDGREVPAFPVNGYQTGVLLPAAGRHDVEISRPGHLWQ